MILIVAEKLEDDFKSILIKFFVECYLSTACSNIKVKQFPDLIKFGKQKNLIKSNSSIKKHVGVLSYMKIPEEFVPFEVSLLNMDKFSY